MNKKIGICVIGLGIGNAPYGLPHHLHCPVTVEAAEAKKHVIVEKPMARMLDEADAMIKAASDNNVVLMVAEHHRYIPAVVKAKELLTNF